MGEIHVEYFRCGTPSFFRMMMEKAASTCVLTPFLLNPRPSLHLNFRITKLAVEINFYQHIRNRLDRVNSVGWGENQAPHQLFLRVLIL